MATKYMYTDKDGNTDTIMVRDDGQVVMWNQHKCPMCLSNVGFMIPNSVANGNEARRKMVAAAAKAGRAELERVTQLLWRQLL